tara:strand:- start:61 stop:966 length:906 start_codon:yes stop_codon:yes gene_type:complete
MSNGSPHSNIDDLLVQSTLEGLKSEAKTAEESLPRFFDLYNVTDPKLKEIITNLWQSVGSPFVSAPYSVGEYGQGKHALASMRGESPGTKVISSEWIPEENYLTPKGAKKTRGGFFDTQYGQGYLQREEMPVDTAAVHIPPSWAISQFPEDITYSPITYEALLKQGISPGDAGLYGLLAEFAHNYDYQIRESGMSPAEIQKSRLEYSHLLEQDFKNYSDVYGTLNAQEGLVHLLIEPYINQPIFNYLSSKEDLSDIESATLKKLTKGLEKTKSILGKEGLSPETLDYIDDDVLNYIKSLSQ